MGSSVEEWCGTSELLGNLDLAIRLDTYAPRQVFLPRLYGL